MNRRCVPVGALTVAALVLVGCGSGGGTSSPPPVTSTPAGTEFTPVSDVKPHAALGQDVAKIKRLLDVAKQGQPIDFAAINEVFEKGGASKKGADKRAADFQRQGKVREPVITSLVAAQAAATRGDEAGLAAATTSARQGLDYVFYLATFKYLDSKDSTGRAEGTAFYQGIQPRVAAADPTADAAITGAFSSGNAAAGRTALNSPAVLNALGIDQSKQATA